MFSGMKKIINLFTNKDGENKLKYESVKISAKYCIIGSLWILFSDKMVNEVVNDRELYKIINIFKGWVYVAVTTVILYNLIKKAFNRISLAEKKLSESYAELSETHEELEATNEELIQQLDELGIAGSKLMESERRLNRAQAIGHVGNWELDLVNNNFWASKESLNLYGIDINEKNISLELFRKIVKSEDRPKMEKTLKSLIEENKKYDVEYRIIKLDDKQERYMHSFAELEYDISGNAAKVLGVVQDITEIKLDEISLKNNNEELSALYEELTASEEELRQQLDEISTSNELLQLSEERFKTLVDNSKDIIYSCDCNGVFTAVNRRFSQYVNIPIKQIIGKKLSDLISNKERIGRWEDTINEVLITGTTMYMENKYEKDTIFEVTISPIFDARKKVIGVTGTNHDITDIRNNEKTIKHMAYYDDLTNLPNKSYFYKQLKTEIENSKVNNKKMFVLFLDMDNFKRVNDTLGHVFGDELLRECARRLKLNIRESDFISRISGDEFLILFKNADDLNAALLVIDRMLETFNDAFYIGNSALNMTASIGISMFPSDGDSVEDLIRCADTAMYKAKDLGRNRYQFYNIEMKNKLLKKFNIELMLRKAIANNELILYYQPQFYAKTKKLRGLEALIRWNNPKLGFLNPLEFISTAEETGLIAPIGEWILNTACCFAKKINDTYMSNITIAVNISPLQLKQSNFYDMVLKAVKNSGIKPENLELEVTENMLIDNFDYTLSLLTELKNYGIKIALDDFGTGYSSLSYLKKLPLDLLKIDKSFIDEINEVNPNNDFTESIISLVHKLNIEALAEGVENTFQYEYLVNAEIDSIQGFYLGKPLPAMDIEKIAKDYYEQEN